MFMVRSLECFTLLKILSLDVVRVHFLLLVHQVAHSYNSVTVMTYDSLFLFDTFGTYGSFCEDGTLSINDSHNFIETD